MFLGSREAPKRAYEFTPQSDITAFELAQILPILLSEHRYLNSLEKLLEKLSDECRRHFTPLRSDPVSEKKDIPQ